MKTSAVTLGAIVVAVGAVIMALVLLLKDETTFGIPTLPIVKTCSGSADCPPLECATCMECHESQHRCVYGLNKVAYCRCVEKETMPCATDTGAPGKSVCEKVDKLHTKWSKCEPLELL